MFARFNFGTPDAYDFYLRMGPLSNSNEKYLKNENPYWNDTKARASDFEKAVERVYRGGKEGSKIRVLAFESSDSTSLSPCSSPDAPAGR